MRTLFYICLVLTCHSAHATTRAARTSLQSSESSCVLRVRFIGPKGIQINGGPGRETRSENAVYWDFRAVGSVDTDCPQDANFLVRIRGADFRGPSSAPLITYPADLAEPGREEIFRLKTKFIQGRDTFLNRDFSEWIFVERLDD